MALENAEEDPDVVEAERVPLECPETVIDPETVLLECPEAVIDPETAFPVTPEAGAVNDAV